jgi:hypothetical protein
MLQVDATDAANLVSVSYDISITAVSENLEKIRIFWRVFNF